MKRCKKNIINYITYKFIINNKNSKDNKNLVGNFVPIYYNIDNKNKKEGI